MPAINSGAARARQRHQDTPSAPQAAPETGQAGGETDGGARNDAGSGEWVAKLRHYRKELTKNATNVGDNFCDQALKMHYGEKKKKAIFGVATGTQIRQLHEHNVAVMPLPPLPEDAN